MRDKATSVHEGHNGSCSFWKSSWLIARGSGHIRSPGPVSWTAPGMPWNPPDLIHPCRDVSVPRKNLNGPHPFGNLSPHPTCPYHASHLAHTETFIFKGNQGFPRSISRR